MPFKKVVNAVPASVLLAGLVLASGATFAQDVYLQAESFSKTLTRPDESTVSVEMWGFASCTDATYSACDAPVAPGPRIDAAEGTPLTIHVNNTLPTPVSVVIPGQIGGGAGSPVMDGNRVRSFTSEIAPGTEGSYTFAAPRAGTFLYQSGTHPSIQVPMGLYGALVVASATPVACASGIPAYDDADSCHDGELVMLFSEIDPVQNAAVAAAGGDVASYPSTIDFSPSYALINGELSADLGGIGDPAASTNVLLRMLNAGLHTHTPAIVGVDMSLVAEDGYVYPGLPRVQAQALLPAGKTLDAIIQTPAADQTFGLYDRTPDFTNAELPQGGLIANVIVNAGSPDPEDPTTYAVDDNYTLTEDTSYSGASILGNDVGLGAGATAELVHPPVNAQSFVLNADGTFDYTPNENFSGTDGFTYSAIDGAGSYPAQVTLSVSFENDAPVAAADGPYVNTVGTTINVDAQRGVLGNDADPDGDTLEAVQEGTVSGLTLDPDGSFSYTGGVGTTTFTYRAEDGNGGVSGPITVTLDISPPSNIALNVQEPDGTAVGEYRWTVEEDTTWHPDPDLPDADSLGTNFHKSYMPVVAQGIGAAEFAQLALDPARHYYVSVLPLDAMNEDATGYRVGHTIGGAQIAPGATDVTVIVNKEPLPYAQISIFVFEDRGPTNGAVDANEGGLGGFQINVEDAGGRYGASAGQMIQDADGNPLTNSLDCFGAATPPPGVILTCPDTPENQAAGIVGEVLIKNLWPGKYGISAVPALNSAYSDWSQTSTIEGTKVIDAWVKAGEPPFFSEFGPAGWHAFIGFVSATKVAEDAAANGQVGTNTVTGTVTNMHLSRPPQQDLFDSGNNAALAHTRAWVGLNSEAGIGTNIAVVQADEDGNFAINGVPDGQYQLVVWDAYLDQVIGYRSVSLPGGGTLGTVPVFQWFARLENWVFLDEDEDGIRDDGEVGLAEQGVLLRWRDGSVYQAFPTDLDGFVPFDQVFPFFHWLVAEVDYARFKPTGLTVTVDHGGDVSGGPYPGLLNPQIQTEDCTPGTSCQSRTETGPVLTQGFQGFLGQTSVFEWGKVPHPEGSNGGISGIVYYGVTRAEADPRIAAAEPWEPGIPRVKVRLYREVETSTGGTALALVAETETDSWDDSLPVNCPGAAATDPVTPLDKCYDGLRNFNQARPAVFDGGYAFDGIPAGTYVVEVVPPPGYEVLKEEDANVSFGDAYASVFVTTPGGAVIPVLPDPGMVEAAGIEPGIAQPPCVGDPHLVPDTLSLFPDANAEAPFRGATRPLCDRKRVILSDQGQAAADFTLFTHSPVAAHYAGMILDDVAQEFNPLSIQFGEKWAPPFVPVSFRDYKGQEIARVYSDQWGRFNGLVPSTFTAYMPSPSGFAPAMHQACMNDPGPIPGPNGELIVDPQYNPNYSNFCYTFQYMPGTTTYLDTPVLPVASYAAGYNPADCALDNGTPMIRQVDGTAAGPLVAPEGTLTITSQGTSVAVPNPAYAGPGSGTEKTITRDFGFGVTAGNVMLGGTELTITSWSDDTIVATLPKKAATGQLVVTRDNGNATEHAITVTVSNETPTRVAAGGSIQAAIDAASPGDLIIVEPGVYNESVIMWKPVRLQGSGAGSTYINAAKRPTETLVQWRDKMDALFAANDVDALPNQPEGAAGFDSSEGAAITVLGRDTNSSGAGAFRRFPSRVDGFSLTGGDVGGGIMVNGFAHELEVANNHVFGNSGLYHGGIRFGQPFLELPATGPFGFNEDVHVHHNSITQNGALGGAGGGLSITTGTDSYTVESNYICGNFTVGNGAGIGHLGLSDQGLIANNRIVLNQSFNQGVAVSGGGVFIGGEAEPGALTQGSGDVTVDANFIQGNQAGAGHGGGIRTQFVNGLDIDNPSVNSWHTITMTNNIVVNNMAGWSGAGIALQDTLRAIIVNNTVAHNDSTATVGALISTNTSEPQPAGLSSIPHSTALEAAIPDNRAEYRGFSRPTYLANNIIWRNRAFYYDASMGEAELQPILSQSAVGECLDTTAYWDVGVLGGTELLSPTYSVLSTTQGTVADPTNTTADPGLEGTFCNGGRSIASGPGSMLALPALDEGGNAWIDVRFGPLDVRGDYHLPAGASSAKNAGANRIGSPSVAPDFDFDGDSRPIDRVYDIGADEAGE